ncbi:MAG: heparan-alpha-glucosaminide N-acetyltransferase domain-containing protein [Candidatus Aminicenantes bacterium]|nr:heparan-alpha-glucosaminide N-acetyltransferase domain-containing protein [Candidatus Aminicenantes bacterium]
MVPNAIDAGGIRDRLFSLDFFRGLTMFLLIGESTLIYAHLVDPSLQGTFLFALGTQFDHHPWAGLRFWDLVQPFFMFIVGVALAFSSAKRERRGDSRGLITRHAVKRALLLLLIGWALYCIEPGRITFRFQNVLAQLAVTSIVAYALMRKPAKVQIAWSFAFILATELIYRLFWVSGFNQPFVPDHNFGAWVDMLISGELSAGHWVSFNAIPTIAHTVWGVLAAQWLMSDRPGGRKARGLAALGAAGIAAGFALTLVTPMIKRICTSSFVVASGGFCLLALALCYWTFDVRKVRKGVVFFNIVGMNSLAIYIFTQTGATEWLKHLVKPFTDLLLGWAGRLPAEILASLAAWALLWSICLGLYRKKILIKI